MGFILFFMVCFKVDSREKQRGVIANNGFISEGYSSAIVSLEFGDYLVDGLVVWEYKTVADFVSSLYDESLFNEVFNQSKLYPFSFLIVEGDFNSYFYQSYFKRGKARFNGSVKSYINGQMRNVTGAIRRLRTVCNVLNFKTQAECLNEIMEQSLKCLDFKGYGGVVRPLDKGFGLDVNPCKAPLMSVARVGDVVSDRIIDMFGLECLDDFSRVSFDGLCEVKGVNEDMANGIWKVIYGKSYDDWFKWLNGDEL